MHGAVGCSELGDSRRRRDADVRLRLGRLRPSTARSRRRREPADLDECNGHTTEADGYHYHANSAAENQVVECLVGQTVDGGDAGRRRRRPPPGGGPPAAATRHPRPPFPIRAHHDTADDRRNARSAGPHGRSCAARPSNTATARPPTPRATQQATDERRRLLRPQTRTRHERDRGEQRRPWPRRSRHRRVRRGFAHRRHHDGRHAPSRTAARRSATSSRSRACLDTVDTDGPYCPDTVADREGSGSGTATNRACTTSTPTSGI